MKRKIKNLIVKIQEYCKLHKNEVFKVVFRSSLIVCGIGGTVIFGSIGFKLMEPKKMTSSDIGYCKERIEKISENNFWESGAVINLLEKEGYDVEMDYESSKITVSYANEESEKIIFSKTKSGFILYKVDIHNVKYDQTMATFGLGFLGGIVGCVTDLMIVFIIRNIQAIFKRQCK